MKIYIMLIAMLFSHSALSQLFIQGAKAIGVGSLQVADFNGDGFNDVFGIRYPFSGKHIPVLFLNTANGDIGFEESELESEISPFGRLAIYDIDSDNDLDIVVTSELDTSLHLFRNDGYANFEIVDLGISGAYVLSCEDFDVDGDIDIAGANLYNDKLFLWENIGNGEYNTRVVFEGDGILSRFRIGDMDGDGLVDFVLGYSQYDGKHIVIYRNLGSNQFEELIVAEDSYRYLDELIVSDIDSDGDNDLLGIRNDRTTAFLNNGDLMDLNTKTLVPRYFSRSVGVEDFNSDGKMDLLIGTNSDGISWHENLSNENLEFGPEIAISGISPAFSILGKDLDNDGDKDVVVSNGDFWWLENVMEETSSVASLESLGIKVYPNPFVDFVELDFNGIHVSELIIYDNLGHVVYQTNEPEKRIELTNFSTGIYFLAIKEKQSERIAITKISK